MYDAFAFLQRFNVPDDCNKHETNGRTYYVYMILQNPTIFH